MSFSITFVRKAIFLRRYMHLYIESYGARDLANFCREQGAASARGRVYNNRYAKLPSRVVR